MHTYSTKKTQQSGDKTGFLNILHGPVSEALCSLQNVCVYIQTHTYTCKQYLIPSFIQYNC